MQTALRAVPGHEIRALATARPESAAESARPFGVPLFFHDPVRLVERPEVVAAVHVAHHLALTKAALRAGKTGYVEWPLGHGSGGTRAARAGLSLRYR